MSHGVRQGGELVQPPLNHSYSVGEELKFEHPNHSLCFVYLSVPVCYRLVHYGGVGLVPGDGSHILLSRTGAGGEANGRFQI